VASVLVIDDSLMARRNTRNALAPAGYDVRETATWADGLAALADRKWAVVVLDLLMPGVDDEVALVKEACAQARGTPVIVVSANNQAVVREAVLRAGAARFVGKPYTPNELLAAIRSATPE
jgi:CheY-like chemotaxis protein